jgi:hypothetical protein
MTESFFEADQRFAEQQLLAPALMHYGVKGMKWGVRKDRSVSSGPQPVQTLQRPGSRVQARGGKNLPASEDAVKAAEARQKARASTTDSLSTKDLQQLVNRMNLEQQYSRLTTPQKSAGKKFADRLMKNDSFKKRKAAAATGAAAAVGAALALRTDIDRVDLSKVY